MADARSGTSDATLRDILTALHRRRALFGGTFACVIVVGAGVIALQPHKYRAVSRIVVDTRALPQPTQSVPFGQPQRSQARQDARTQLEVIRSAAVLDGAIAKALPDRAHSQHPAPDVFVTVRQVDDTDVIEIAAESSSPTIATRVANQVPATYLAMRRQDRDSASDVAVRSSMNELAEATRQMRTAEFALTRFDTQNPSVGMPDQARERIVAAASVAAEVRKAAGSLAGLTARLAALHQQRRGERKTIVVPTETTNSQIETLRRQIGALRAERASLLVLYKPEHARIEEVDAQIADVNRQLREIPPMVATVTRMPNPGLRALDDRIAETAAAQSEARAQLAEMQAEATSTREPASSSALLARREALADRAASERTRVSTLQRYLDNARLQAGSERDLGTIITPASAATRTSPRTGLIMVMMAVTAALLASAAALIAEYLDDRLYTADQAATAAGAPVMSVPLQADENSRQTGPPVFPVPGYGILRASIEREMDGGSGVVAIVDTAGGAGAAIALGLASEFAREERRTVLVDAGVFAPALHKMLTRPLFPGLADLANGAATVCDALQPTPLPHLQFLSAGCSLVDIPAWQPAHLIRDVLRQLPPIADMTVVYAPNLSAAIDLGSAVQAIAVTAKAGETRAGEVRYVVQSLQATGYSHISVIMAGSEELPSFGKVPTPAVWAAVRASVPNSFTRETSEAS